MPNFFVDVRQDLIYAYGWPSRFVRPIWRVKRAPKRAYASFRRFSCAIAHYFLGDPDSAVMANRMHRQGLDGRPRNFFSFLTSEFGSPKKWCAIAHENRRNEAYAPFGARLTLQMGRTIRDGQPYA
uniref:Uncharacterized protein n=1 Tax=Solanum lycopersicum TaxID=4081 RepID=A0A3Q7HJM2_SOLLC